MLRRKTVYKTKTVKKRVRVKTIRWVVEPCYVRLGKAIKQARLHIEMHQEDLANKIGVSRAALANMEAGRQRIYLHHLFAFEKVFPENAFVSIARGKESP